MSENIIHDAQWEFERPTLSAPVELVNVERYKPVPNRTDFVSRDLRRTLTSIQGPSFTLLRSEFPDIEPYLATASFTQAPFGLMEPTRMDSKHEVKFGQLSIQSVDRRQSVELVALKPLENPARVVNEFGAMQHVNSYDFVEGRPRAFQALGFYRDTALGQNFLITKYEHSVISLDSLMWDPEYDPSEIQIEAALGHCAVLLGDLHARGIMHGDAQIKNMASDNYGPRVIDLEFAQRPRERNGLLDPMQARTFIEHDLRYCLEDFGDRTSLIDEWFTPIYLEAFKSSESVAPEMSVPTEKEIRQIPL